MQQAGHKTVPMRGHARGLGGDTSTKQVFLTGKCTSSRVWLRVAAVAHLIIALTVLMALTHMDNTQVQAAAAYAWAFLALLLTVGTFTSDKEQ